MKQTFGGWDAVARNLEARAKEDTAWFNAGQRASLCRLAERIPKSGMILADEVGMGKTRIASALARAVTDSGGRVAILVPPGVGFQWTKELRDSGIADPPQILRSLWSYLAAWDPDEKTQRLWFEQPILLLSHAFANWRFGNNANPDLAWRWSLLPCIYAEWRKRRTGRYPNQFHCNEYLDDDWVLNAARNICTNAPQDERSEVFRRLKEIEDETPWPQAVDAGMYGRNSELRTLLESAVGLGFGSFDLVIIDEAHKSRGADAMLSRLLEKIILKSYDVRRLAMTATPIELDVSQWKQTLQRLGISEASLRYISQGIEDYAGSVQRIRHSWRSSEEARASYRRSAQAFERSLAPYLLRRDKREDETVQRFARHAMQDTDAYRLEKEIVIRLEDLTPAWRQVVCAAESLSLVTHQADDPVAKRLRLTIGNGHAIASLIDHLQKDGVADAEQEEAQTPSEIDSEAALPENERGMDKRYSRAEWWRNLMAKASASHGLYNHPAILKAVEAIEAYTMAQEKVLVFGRFTRPLKAITELLNAREMLRCLQDGRPWPQSVVHVMAEQEEDERPAVEAAYRQLNCKFGFDQIDSMLGQQYRALEARRKKLSEHLLPWISEGLADHHGDARALLEAAGASIQDVSKAGLTRAIDDLLDDPENPDPEQCAKAFIDLMAVLQDNDVSGADGDNDLDQKRAVTLWPEIAQRLDEEYGSQRGTFARLMYGETKPETRRALQLGFNRARSLPRVLVAQSMVGREGLNLHQACRVVVLLHPEWNPGVVEQQIGRVDRVGSHWAKQLGQAIEAGTVGDSLPRIEICPVIFQGTYDEYHWKVLNERWDDLRAQLHGVIVPRRLRNGLTAEESEIARELDKNAPNFSPSK